jgi:hypothetical protein
VIGLGSYPAVSRADVRAKAAEVHALIDKGIDPFEARKAAERAGRPVPTFAEIANLVSDDAQARSTNAKVRYQWARHLGPALPRTPQQYWQIGQITANRQFSPQGPLGVRNEMRRLSVTWN